MKEMKRSLASPATRRFIQIPGPNPIVVRGEWGSWDDGCLETGDIFKDYTEGQEIYYLYYHAFPNPKRLKQGYEIGVATSTQPLGPFTKAVENPILMQDHEHDWEDAHVACPTILKRGCDEYLMFYWSKGKSDQGHQGNICIANSSHPLGPWKKYKGNPVFKNSGYIGGIFLVEGTYYMYAAYPIGSSGEDYGPMALATSKDPYGPWERHEGNPVIKPSGWGSWDDGGYSEAKFIYHDGLFHTFYGGAKLHTVRRRSLESIGYAFSEDGKSFIQHVDNPVATRERNPDASAFGEVQCLMEPPFVYLYHTLRYLSTSDEDIDIEDLGVQVLATDTPFKLNMPVLHFKSLDAQEATGLANCSPISLDRVNSVSLTVECAYDQAATSSLRLYVRTSYDGFSFDTVDFTRIDHPLKSGELVRGTHEVNVNARFIKVLVENPDPKCSVMDLKVTATLGSP